MVELKSVPNNNIELLQLVSLLDIDLNSRYGNLQKGYNKFNTLASIDTAVVAYVNSNPVGCGCFRVYGSQAIEIKRMFVMPEFRGKGIAKLILDHLEQTAKQKGFEKAVLETGIGQPEAIRFYEKSGYQLAENYGQYVGNSNSICMSKSFG